MPTTGPHVQWTFFLALVIGALVILAFVAVSRARRAEEDAEAQPDDALEPVAAAGVEALESERDPRRAVIKAYLTMVDGGEWGGQEEDGGGGWGGGGGGGGGG